MIRNYAAIALEVRLNPRWRRYADYVTSGADITFHQCGPFNRGQRMTVEFDLYLP